jgi:hypothetical protein
VRAIYSCPGQELTTHIRQFPLLFSAFGRESEDRGCPDDEEDVNGLEVRSGLWDSEETGHSQL